MGHIAFIYKSQTTGLRFMYLKLTSLAFRKLFPLTDNGSKVLGMPHLDYVCMIL